MLLVLLILIYPTLSIKPTNAGPYEPQVVIGTFGSINLNSGTPSSVTYVVALDGSGDFTDIQSAIDAVPPTALGTIIVKSGIYDLNPQYYYPYKSIVLKSNIILRGEGIDQTIIRSFPDKQPYGSNIRRTTIIADEQLDNVIIENLTVIQNGTPDLKGYGGIRLGSCTNVIVRNVMVTDVTGEALQISGNALVEDCFFDRIWTGIAISGPSDGAVVRNNYIYNTGGDGIFPQATGGAVTNLVIENNHLEHITDTAIDITGDKTKGIRHQNIVAIGNEIVNGSIRISGADNIQLLNNTITYGQISVDPGQGHPTNIQISGNIIVDFPHNLPIGVDPTYTSAAIIGNGYDVIIDSNMMFSDDPDALWAISTWGSWTVTNNALTVPGKVGNAAVQSSGLVQGNYEY
jgi:polygalacturonase